jgi:hypothetical protein
MRCTTPAAPAPSPSQALALGCLAKLAAADPALPDAILGSGVLDSLVVSSQHEAEPVQAAADAALQALAAVGAEAAARVVDTGAVACMVRQLEHGSPLVGGPFGSRAHLALRSLMTYPVVSGCAADDAQLCS